MTAVARAPFLRAEWRQLAMLNFEVDPTAVRPLVPAGTELDAWAGRFYVSVVGFRFLRTRVWGLGIPFHRNFEEVNLRFYVRRHADDGWRRAVVFVKEIVPRAAIALAARALYNENYVALPMSHALSPATGDGWVASAAYAWRHDGREHRLDVVTTAPPSLPPDGSEEQFITEHYWGYVAQRDGGTVESRVEHPPWRVARATEARLDCDAAALYGAAFGECLAGTPTSAFLADGSAVTVSHGRRLSR